MLKTVTYDDGEWQLVPKVPTDEMCRVGEDALYAFTPAAIYGTMLAHAPQPTNITYDAEHAKMYQWLRSQTAIEIFPDTVMWTGSDGKKFKGSYCVRTNNTQYAPAPSLDEVIRQAMEISKNV